MVNGEKNDTAPGLLNDFRLIAERFAPPENMTYGSPGRRFPRPGEQNMQARHCAANADALATGVKSHACCHARLRRPLRVGDPPPRKKQKPRRNRAAGAAPTR